jgi:hypothetical protein
MSTAKVVEKVAAPAADVWDQLADFGGLKVGGMIQSFEVEGEGVGAVRTIGVAGGSVIERLDRHDSDSLTFTYSIINEDCPLPVSGYSATVQITDDGDGACTVDWTGTFEPKGAPEEQAITIVKGIYTGGIQGARQALGV